MRANVAAMMSVALVAAAPAGAAETSATARTAIEGLLANSAAAWTAGDLTRFMTLYENAPTTTYLTSSKRVQGYDAIRAMYAADFGAGSAAMGKLALNVLEVRTIGGDHAYVTVRFTLTQPGTAEPATGYSTLLMRKSVAGWRIVADHS